jgi:hypothetical protein
MKFKLEGEKYFAEFKLESKSHSWVGAILNLGIGMKLDFGMRGLEK